MLNIFLIDKGSKMLKSRVHPALRLFRLATTNSGKISSLRQAGFDLDTISCEDTPEPDGSLIEIVVEKSRRAGAMTIVEDTCCFIDGHPDAGTHIKYFEQNNKMPDTIGCRAVNQVGIGLNDGDNVHVFTASVQGLMKPPKEGTIEDSGMFAKTAYSFYFQPDGASDIFEHLPSDEAMAFSPRIRAMNKVALAMQGLDIQMLYHAEISHALWKASDFSTIATGHWTGPWQKA